MRKTEKKEQKICKINRDNGNNRNKLHVFAALFAVLLILINLVPFAIVLVSGIYQRETGVSFQAYYDVFLGSPRYLLCFWRSLGICLGITAGQIVISVLAGYGFAKCKFPGKNIMFFFLMILMVLPLQVTLVPNYIMLDRLNLLGTDASLILPGMFVPLGTFIMTQSFKAVSSEMIDVAKLDGCGIPRILMQIVVPMNKGSLVCVGLLSFLDSWNMVEQPIAYLKDFTKYPISVALAYVSNSDFTRQIVCCILVMLPPLFLFSCFSKEMVEGIVFGEEK